nr:hypothetical protein Iba_chr12eCG11900 [Ipomoea batatas]
MVSERNTSVLYSLCTYAGTATFELMDMGINLLKIYNLLLTGIGHIIDKLLRILKEKRNYFNHKIWVALILQFLKLQKLIIQKALIFLGSHVRYKLFLQLSYNFHG